MVCYVNAFAKLSKLSKDNFQNNLGLIKPNEWLISFHIDCEFHTVPRQTFECFHLVTNRGTEIITCWFSTLSQSQSCAGTKILCK
jgi:hypothetical protein